VISIGKWMARFLRRNQNILRSTQAY